LIHGYVLAGGSDGVNLGGGNAFDAPGDFSGFAKTAGSTFRDITVVKAGGEIPIFGHGLKLPERFMGLLVVFNEELLGRVGQLGSSFVFHDRDTILWGGFIETLVNVKLDGILRACGWRGGRDSGFGSRWDWYRGGMTSGKDDGMVVVM